MTIDSTYLGYDAHEVDFLDSVYYFPWETIGSSTFVIKISYVSVVDGLTYVVDVDPTNYYLTYGGKEPIFHRGSVTFYNPRATFVNDDVTLLFGRKTPIVQEIDLIPYTPAPIESVEFAIDKLTMILQEIEGDKCPCPFGGTAPEPPPLCVPVLFDAQLDPANVYVGQYAQPVTWSALVLGTGPFTYQWSLNNVDIVGATGSTFSKTIDGVEDIGTYTVTVSNDCGVANSSAIVSEEPCYACDSFSTFTSSLPGVFVYTPTSQYSNTPGYRFVNGEILAPTVLGPGIRVVGGDDNNGLFLVDQTGGLLDSCGNVLAVRQGGIGSPLTQLEATTELLDTFPGPTLAGGILVDTLGLDIDGEVVSTFSMKAGWPSFPVSETPFPFIGTLNVLVNLTARPRIAGSYDANASIQADIQVYGVHEDPIAFGQLAAWSVETVVVPDIYQFYRRTSGQGFCNPLYLSAYIEASGFTNQGSSGAKVIVRLYAGFGYRDSTGPVGTEGMVYEHEFTSFPLDVTPDINRKTELKPPQMFPTNNTAVFWQDLWIGSSITTPSWTATLNQAKRNQESYGCTPGFGCVPVVLGPITNNNGLEATSFPFTTTLTANVTSATTDQVLYQWFFNGSPITIRGPQFYQQTVTVDDISEIGNYTVTAVNACGSSSASVEITYNPPVCVPVTVTLNPPGDQWPTGSPGPVTLIASASGSDPFTYEFFLDGVLQTGDVGGTLYVAFDDPSQFGTYTVNAYNDCGSDSDSQTWTDPGPVCVPVNIDVEPTPLEWFPTNETTLSPAWVIAASGTAPINYQWYFNTDNGEVGTPVAGETDPALTRFYATPDRVGYYWVQAINDCGTDTSQRVHVNDIPTACIPVTVPQIEPSFTDVGGGSETVTWTAVPEGTAPFAYQWYFDPYFSGGPTPIVGETGPSLTVTVGPTDYDDWGDYICEITNDCGSTSTSARITGPV